MKKLCLVLALLSTALPSHAQECDRLLEPDITAMSQDTMVRLAYLHTLDRTQYDKHKSGGGIGIAIPVDGIPLNGTANYDDFKEKLRKESERTHYRLDITDSRWYYATRVPPERTQAFVDCVNPTGLKLRLVSRVEDTVVLKLSWHPSGDAVKTARLSYGASVNVANLNELPTSIGPNAERLITVRRRAPRRTMLVAINSGAHPAFYRDPPTLKAPPPLTTLARAIVKGQPCIVRLTSGIGTLVPNSDYILRYTESGNQFTATGHNARRRRSETYSYSNASLNLRQITIWGAIFTFAEDGQLKHNGKPIGEIRCT